MTRSSLPSRMTTPPFSAVGRRALDLGDHDVQVGAEGAGEPAVGVDVLPVARPPGVVAQAVAVDLVRLVVDGTVPVTCMCCS